MAKAASLCLFVGCSELSTPDGGYKWTEQFCGKHTDRMLGIRPLLVFIRRLTTSPRNCRRCRWYRPASNAGSGACMVAPPVLVTVGKVTAKSLRPVVFERDYCKQWEAGG